MKIPKFKKLRELYWLMYFRLNYHNLYEHKTVKCEKEKEKYCLDAWCGNGWEPWFKENYSYGTGVPDEVKIYFKRKKIITTNDLPNFLNVKK